MKNGYGWCIVVPLLLFCIVDVLYCSSAPSASKSVRNNHFHHNTGEYEVLCKIYRITQARPPKPEFKNRKAEERIMRRLEELFSYTEDVRGATADNESASKVIERLYERAKLLRNWAEENRTKAEEASKKVGEEMAAAVYGELAERARGDKKAVEDMMEEHKGLLFNDKGSAQESCGSGKTKKTGKTLINDFFCLCAGQAGNNGDGSTCSGDEGQQSPCHANLRRPTSTNWTKVVRCDNGTDGRSSGVTKDLPAAWKEIGSHCMYKNVASNVKTLRAVLEEFHKLANMAQKAHQVKGIFGHVDDTKKSDHVCDGQKRGTTCVDYTNIIDNGEIPWLQHLSAAADSMDEMKKHQDAADSHLHKLQDLEGEAEQAFIEFKFSGGLEGLVEKPLEDDFDSEATAYPIFSVTLYMLSVFVLCSI